MHRRQVTTIATIVFAVGLFVPVTYGQTCVTDADCDDGDFCNGAERCIAGDCRPGDDPCSGTCDETTDTCPCATDVDCADGIFCNGSQACDPQSNVCRLPAPACVPGQACDEDTDSCFECGTDGECDDGVFCNGIETCDLTVNPHMCVAPGDLCGIEACDEDNDLCFDCVNDVDCDDGVYCNGPETCTSGDCGAGAIPCPAQGCDEDDESCFGNCATDADCDDGVFCNGVQTCEQQFHTCLAPVDPCPGQACDETNDVCFACAGDSDCDDGVFCNGAETCSGGTCLAGTGCDFMCDEAGRRCLGECENGEDSECDDGIFCNGVETCDQFDFFCLPGAQPCPGQACDEGGPTCFDCTSDGDCDDGIFCNGAETCDGGPCLPGSSETCNDGIDCTVDSCNFDTDACEHTSVDAACDNGLFCDGPETCDQSAGCLAGADPCQPDEICNDDLDLCSDSCFVDADRDDGDFCNGTETCDSDLVCQPGVPEVCDDGEDCTDDTCDAQDECVYTPNDNNTCTDNVGCTDDACVSGSCVSLPNDANCDDGEDCTDDTCDAQNDCVYTPDDNNTCTDNVACTDDACMNGSCVSSPNDALCDDGIFCTGVEFCHPVLLVCQAGDFPTCDDGIECTIDTCDFVPGAVCENAADDSRCDDGLFCNGAETCDPVFDCPPGTHPCPDQVCDENLQQCFPCIDDSDCDDAEECTVDTCDQVSGCQHTNSTGACDDGNACTIGDTCADGECVSEPVLNCDDGTACTVDSCNVTSGLCLHVADNSACDDGVFCNGVNVCDPASGDPTTGCLAGPSPCSANEVCNEDTDTCVNIAGGGCISDADCNDGAFCNGVETCVSSVCHSGASPCGNDQVCDPSNGACVECILDTQCDDGLICTVDSCDQTTKTCAHAANHSICDDGAFCNGAEICDTSLDCRPDDSPCGDQSCDEENDVCLGANTETGTIGALGSLLLEVDSLDGESTAIIEITRGSTGQRVDVELLDGDGAPGLEGAATFTGFAGEAALGVTLRVTTPLGAGTFSVLIRLTVQQSVLDVFNLAEQDAALHVLDEDAEEPTWVPAGNNFLGQADPTQEAGDYGYFVGGETVTFWAVLTHLSLFAIGEPAEPPADGQPDTTGGDELEEPAPTDDEPSDDTGSIDDTVGTDEADGDTPAEQPVPDSTPPPACGAAPCGTLGLLTLPMIALGLATMRRHPRRR